jgi:phosphoribosylanthranilate isomerase
MWVKICANTNVEDATLAARLGADAVGFVFAPSKRRVTAEQVAQISPRLPPTVERVGVFESRDAAEIERIVVLAGLNAIQLHSDFDIELLEQLSHRMGAQFALIQTLHWTVGPGGQSGSSANGFSQSVSDLKNFNSRRHIRVLVDSKIGGASGGTGVPFDWDAAAAAFADARAAGLELIAAGGLSPDNVGQAIRRLTPWGVDVATGVEATPGRKDPARLASFLQRAHGD